MAPVTTEIKVPSVEVMDHLMKALEYEKHAYIIDGGGRNFAHEDLQDDAQSFVVSLRAIARGD